MQISTYLLSLIVRDKILYAKCVHLNFWSDLSAAWWNEKVILVQKQIHFRIEVSNHLLSLTRGLDNSVVGWRISFTHLDWQVSPRYTSILKFPQRALKWLKLGLGLQTSIAVGPTEITLPTRHYPYVAHRMILGGTHATAKFIFMSVYRCVLEKK